MRVGKVVYLTLGNVAAHKNNLKVLAPGRAALDLLVELWQAMGATQPRSQGRLRGVGQQYDHTEGSGAAI